jgi:hypothetical protein
MGRRAMKREFAGTKGTPRADDIGSINEWDDNDDEWTFRVSLSHNRQRVCTVL